MVGGEDQHLQDLRGDSTTEWMSAKRVDSLQREVSRDYGLAFTGVSAELGIYDESSAFLDCPFFDSGMRLCINAFGFLPGFLPRGL